MYGNFPELFYNHRAIIMLYLTDLLFINIKPKYRIAIRYIPYMLYCNHLSLVELQISVVSPLILFELIAVLERIQVR